MTARPAGAVTHAVPGAATHAVPGAVTPAVPGAAAATPVNSRARRESGVAAWRVLRCGSFCGRHNI